MDLKILPRTKYEEQFGLLVPNRGMRPETVALWEKLRKMPIDSVAVIECATGKELKPYQHYLCTKIARLLRLFKANFRVTTSANRNENHIVILKSPK